MGKDLVAHGLLVLALGREIGRSEITCPPRFRSPRLGRVGDAATRTLGDHRLVKFARTQSGGGVMRRWRSRGSSRWMTLALLALFVAPGGTSLAASNYVITSTKQIRPSVLRALHGTRGPDGLRGLAGATGPQGFAGAPGAAGALGGQGVTGATGPEGKEGKTGATGATGPESSAGAKGATGATGAQGATGVQGATGAPGATGVQGATGATGPQGKEGKTGATGATGAEGGTGGKGPTGPEGKEGKQGKEGAKGEAGAAATTLWTVVAATGELVRGGTGSLEAEQLEPGLYQVTFNRDVTKCAYIVSLGNANGPLGVHGSADATGGKTVEEADSVSVETTNDKGERTAEPFHLAVFC